MKNGAEICADPSVDWVKKIMEAKDKMFAKKLQHAEPKITNWTKQQSSYQLINLFIIL